MLKNKIPINLLVFFLYFVISIIFTFPLIFNILNYIPGTEGDSFLFVWNSWWVKYSLLNFQNPYFTDLLAYPFETNLVFHTLTFSNSLVSAFLQLFLPLILSFNIFFIFSLTFACYGMFILCYYLIKNYYIAFYSGVLFVFNVYIFGLMSGHFNNTSIYIIPFFLLFFIKIFYENKFKNAIIAGFLLSFSFYNNFYYTVGLLIFSALIVAWFLAKDKKLIIKKAKQIIFCFLTWLIISSPLLFLSVKTALSGEYPLAKLTQINLYSPDIRSFFVPPTIQTIYGDRFANYYNSLGYHGSIVYVSFLLLFLAIIGYFFGKKNNGLMSGKFWLLCAIIFLFLTLGPFLYFDGYIFNLDGIMFTIPLPYLLFYLLPFVKGILVPPKFIIFVIFCLIILSSFFLSFVFKKLGDRRILKVSITALLAGVFMFENFSLPISITNAEVPSFYYQLQKEVDNYAILELPFALSTSFYTLGEVPSSAKLGYYQSVHQKEILGGYISRVPDDYYYFYSKIVGLDYLINPQNELDLNDIEQIKRNVIDNFSKLRIKYIIIHPEFYDHRRLRNTIDFLNHVYDKRPETINNMLVYQLY